MTRPIVAYVDHSHHTKTKSTAFFLEYLQREFEVDVFWDESWKGKPCPPCGGLALRKNYDHVFFFQTLPSAETLQLLKCKSVFLIPMFDQIKGMLPSGFSVYRDAKFISFSSTLHRFLTALGHYSMHIQFFPDVQRSGEPENTERAESAFLWQRRPPITFDLVKRMVEGSGLRRFHVHSTPDPGYEDIHAQVAITNPDLAVTISNWFEKSEDFARIVEECDVFFAPRPYEGIGMPFLEAMALGKCVIAPDLPTHNEYIIHGENGYLYQLDSPSRLDLSGIQQVRRNALQSIVSGRQAFLAQMEALLQSILSGDFSPFGVLVLNGKPLSESAIRLNELRNLELLKELELKRCIRSRVGRLIRLGKAIFRNWVKFK
jgi:glycosyltransferase involved in cell wall biosynthesis